MSKYNSKKTKVDEITFDSKMEAKYYIYLKEQKKNGHIKDFELQPEFILQPSFLKHGKKFLPIKYKADFKVINIDNSIEIIDVKGFTTADFNLKKKMFNYHFDFPLKLITESKIDGGWIELDDLKKARKERKKARESKNSKDISIVKSHFYGRPHIQIKIPSWMNPRSKYYFTRENK